MKAKSKLFTVIITMVAAIAIMGVGVWASSSQTFRLTVQNDIDIRIDSVVADVWGDYAVYTEMTAINENLKMAKRTAKDDAGSAVADAPGTTGQNAYLLYSKLLNGYNDGQTIRYDENADLASSPDAWTDVFVPGHSYDSATNPTPYTAIGGSGLGKYLNGANYQYLDSGDTDTATETTDILYPNAYANIDFTTTYAQIVYMYTIRQYYTPGTTNNIYLTVQDEVTADFADKISDADGNARVQRNYYITNGEAGSEWLPLNAGVKAYAVAAATTEATVSDFVQSAPQYLLPSPAKTGAWSESQDQVWHVMCVYTLERNAYNLDLAGLADGIGHSISLLNAEQVDRAYGDGTSTTNHVSINYSNLTPSFNGTASTKGQQTIGYYEFETSTTSITQSYAATATLNTTTNFLKPSRTSVAGSNSTGKAPVTIDDYDVSAAFGDSATSDKKLTASELATACKSVFNEVSATTVKFAFRFENMITNGTNSHGVDQYDFYNPDGFQGNYTFS